MKFRFLEIARLELADAIDYYDNKEPELGDRFLDEISEAVDRIASNPRAWFEIGKGVRRCATQSFPYHLVYKLYPDEFVVIAIMHMRRDPESWVNRMQAS